MSIVLFLTFGAYFQHVEITDRYRDANGEYVAVENCGVNKIKGGKMWCVVIKPDETVEP